MPLTQSVTQESVDTPSGVALSDKRGSTSAERLPADNDAKVCWMEVKRYPYQPDHQVDLMHLQAEADALLIKLQTSAQKERNH